MKWQPAPMFLHGKFHGERSWWGMVHATTESDTTEQTKCTAPHHVHIQLDVALSLALPDTPPSEVAQLSPTLPILFAFVN